MVMGKKPNAFLAQLAKQHERDLHIQRLFCMQWCADAALLAVNEVFQRRGPKLAEFHEAFMRYSQEIARMTVDDARGDKSIEYTKARLDERLKELLGDDFVPWDERYKA